MEVMLGNTKVILDDSFCRDQPSGQREEILRRAADIVREALVRQEREKAEGSVGGRTGTP